MSEKNRAPWSPRPWHTLLSGIVAEWGNASPNDQTAELVAVFEGIGLKQMAAQGDSIIFTADSKDSVNWVVKSCRMEPARSVVFVERGRMGSIPVITLTRGDSAAAKIEKRDASE